ncbi:MAG: ECF transporter S component [Clostridia bacterium]|nr:ECF transporter S component [Clostridia bacterium]
MKHYKGKLSTKKLVVLALFTALAYIVSFLSFPIFPAAGFLKLDFGNVFIMLAGFLFGPPEAIAVTLAKELLALIGTETGGVGEIANFLMTSSFVILPSILYRFRKGINTVVLSLCGACVIGTVTAAIVNRFITFPLYEEFIGPADAAFNFYFWYVIGFNILKTVSISILTVLLYKRLSRFLTEFGAK